MLRDTSQIRTVQKFSFIESLSLSRAQNSPQKSPVKLNTDLAFRFQQLKTQAQPAAANAEKNALAKGGALVLSRETATIDANWYQSTPDYSLSLAKIISDTADSSFESNSSSLPSPNNSLSKMLFAFACSYCLFVVWWLFGHQSHHLWTNLTGGQNVTLLKSDVEFIDYLERSLNKIERDVASQNREEVVYIPVYSPAPPTQVASNVPQPLPLSSLPSTTSKKIAAPPSPLPIPAPPPLPLPTPIANPLPNIAAASKPKISHALIGILELGEGRSAALIKVQGKTRRVWIGEEINADGWVLESVGNQQANISYQGQVRSISVGETF